MSHGRATQQNRERAALVGLVPKTRTRDEAEASLDELAGLADAAGATVVLRELQARPRADPATFIGKGKVDALALASDARDVDVVVVDDDLTPAQLGHLQERLGRRVIDRTQLILDIFARRARTREGKLQVELAQLKYLLPRLGGRGPELSRLGGGIGTRGPGETKLETDRRRIRTRVQALSRELDEVGRRRRHGRGRRVKASVPTIALVGYTNAGKTTLFNRLTHAGAVASDALFVTLDPLVRRLRLPGGQEASLVDTVGFIDRLPHTLVAAFRATLEELTRADLLLHVVDASNPERDRQAAAVLRVLDEVGARDVPRLEVLNKADRVPDAERRRLAAQSAGGVWVSATDGTGVAALLAKVESAAGLEARRVTLTFDTSLASHRAAMGEVYRVGTVVSQVLMPGRVVIEADVPRRLLARLPHVEEEVLACAT